MNSKSPLQDEMQQISGGGIARHARYGNPNSSHQAYSMGAQEGGLRYARDPREELGMRRLSNEFMGPTTYPPDEPVIGLTGSGHEVGPRVFEEGTRGMLGEDLPSSMPNMGPRGLVHEDELLVCTSCRVTTFTEPCFSTRHEKDGGPAPFACCQKECPGSKDPCFCFSRNALH